MKRSYFAALCGLALTLSAPTAQADTTPYLGQVMTTAGVNCPRGWMPMDGKLMSIGDNAALFAVIGALYGGDGRTTFALPDMRARSPVHRGNGGEAGNVAMGHKAGDERVTLSVDQIPAHSHNVKVVPRSTKSTENLSQKPEGMIWGITRGAPIYGPFADLPDIVSMNEDAMLVEEQTVGQGKSVYNRDPYLTLLFCIAIDGLLPNPR